ncbi:MAG: hypothetical protein RJB65_2351 [Actinomycetota bacterium]
MYRFLATPRWIGFHLLCAAAVAGMVTAGFWQLSRLDQRAVFKDDVRSRTAAPVVDLAELRADGDDGLVADEWRRVEATGTYLADPQFTVVNVSQDGSAGQDPVNGLLLDDGTVLIVNRGFTTSADAVPPPPTGTVTVTGRIRLSQTAGYGQASDDGTQPLTQIRRVDLGALSQQFEQPVLPVYIDQTDMSIETAGRLVPVAFPNLDGGPPHLSYALQWFTFSASVAVGWVLAVRKSVRTRKGIAPKRRPPVIDDSYAAG